MYKKNVLLIALCFLLSTPVFSQFGVKGGFTMIQPVGDNGGKFHAGFEIGGTYNISEALQVELLLEPAFRKYGNVSSSIFPVTIGMNYSFLTDNIKPYVGLNLGAYNFRSKVNVGSFKSSPQGNSHFGIAPKAGIAIELMDHLFLDITVKYNAVFYKKYSYSNSGGGVGVRSLITGNIGVNYIF